MKNRIALAGFVRVTAVVVVFSFPSVLFAIPEILVAPTNQTVMAGLPFQMRVVARSPLPLTYQWMLTRDNAIPRTVNLPDGTNSLLVVSNTLATSAGLYSVKISDSSGSVTTDNTHVRVLLLQLRPDDQCRLEMWNNVLGTAVRIEMTTNLVNSLSTFTVINALSSQWNLSSDLPCRFFRARPIPLP